MDAKLASALSTSATSLDSCCAGAIVIGPTGDAWQPHCVELQDSTKDCVLLISIAAMGHPTAQHLEDFAFPWHGITPNKGAAPRATKRSVATSLEKIFMPDSKSPNPAGARR
jgi:hypothetical protein